ncbi:hypothetical protein AMECASPLE_002249 [Ameca splendens]|uniref:Uncharacterized protein n=1 Tax=Ameca splendens TaxID=208324 RepID=A0ABV0YKJ3_9TELE
MSNSVSTVVMPLSGLQEADHALSKDVQSTSPKHQSCMLGLNKGINNGGGREKKQTWKPRNSFTEARFRPGRLSNTHAIRCARLSTTKSRCCEEHKFNLNLSD